MAIDSLQTAAELPLNAVKGQTKVTDSDSEAPTAGQGVSLRGPTSDSARESWPAAERRAGVLVVLSRTRMPAW